MSGFCKVQRAMNVCFGCYFRSEWSSEPISGGTVTRHLAQLEHGPGHIDRKRAGSRGAGPFTDAAAEATRRQR